MIIKNSYGNKIKIMATKVIGKISPYQYMMSILAMMLFTYILGKKLVSLPRIPCRHQDFFFHAIYSAPLLRASSFHFR